MNEMARLRALAGYAVLDTPPEPNFDRLTKLASTIFELPICTLSFTDAGRVWFKSRYGITATEMPRRMSFCEGTIRRREVFIVPDALADVQFAHAPAVAGPPHVRFYAGAPLISPDGSAVGSLCVLDRQPHFDFDDRKRGILTDLASTVVELLEARLRQVELAKRTEEIAHLAHHDPLTGLANRLLLRDHMEAAVAQADEEEQIAVLYLDLDHFKAINDQMGHHIGDALLSQVAERLRANVRTTDEVARLGGDEFAIVQTGAQVRRQAAELAGRLIRTLSEPFLVEGQKLSIGASIGIAVGVDSASHSDQLLREADNALYQAKAEGRGKYCFFEPDMAGWGRPVPTLGL